MLRYFALAVVLALSTASAGADTYPARPISLVVPFGPGSATDIFARIVTQTLQDDLGQTIIVDNKPGANAVIAAEYVARAQPDGYTLMISTASAHASNVYLIKNLRYDPIKDFEPIAWIGTVNFFVAVEGSSPYKTLDDLLTAARKNPGKLSFANSSASAIVSNQAVAKFGGLDVIHVPYKSSPQAMTDVVAGQVTAMIADFPAAASYLASGKLRALAVTGAKRSELYPDIPTLAELGMKDFDLIGWFGIYAPAGTPKDVVQLLSKKLSVVMAKPAVKQRLNQLGYEVFSTSPDALRDHTKAEIANWGRYVKDFDILTK
ncbi:MAG: Bug family tripartite tricarboxylate transporter substrate binding protein [Variibacter sp.]